jgi:creatinine amidohydrolase
MTRTWARYEELRPDQRAEIIRGSPVAIWPLALLEHHGWHLPIGYDGLKADRLCVRIAERTGGVVLPVMWWGGGGGHGGHLFTHYQDTEAAGRVVATTAKQLISFGFRVIVILAGHYPWHGVLDLHLSPIRDANPETLLLWGIDPQFWDASITTKGDHAARDETSMGMALFPEFIDMSELRPRAQRDAAAAWPGGKAVVPEGEWKTPTFDATSRLFSQWWPEGGQDASFASVEHGERLAESIVETTARKVNTFLNHG